MNKRDLQNWLERYSSELSPEDWKTLQQLLQEAESNAESEASLQRFLKVEHFFNEWHKQRYQQNLDLSLTEKNELRERLRKLDQKQDSNAGSSGARHRRLPLYWVGGVAAAILVIILFNLPAPQPDYDSGGPMVIQDDNPGERQTRSSTPDQNSEEPSNTEEITSPDKGDEQEDPVDEPNTGEDPPVLPEVPVEQMYAANFEPNFVLDDLIEDSFRDDSNILVEKPPLGDTLKQNPEFVLKNIPTEKFIIEILSNQNHVVLADTLLESEQKYLPNTQAFTPGLYYWKVYVGEDMIGIGKFYWVP